MKTFMLITLLSLGSASVAQAAPCNSKPVDSITSSSQQIVVSADKPEFTIRLQANPTTGYNWSVKRYNTRLLTLVKNEFIPPASNCIGAGGVETWVFKTNSTAFIRPTTTIIKMEYARSWEKQGGKKITFIVVTRRKN